LIRGGGKILLLSRDIKLYLSSYCRDGEVETNSLFFWRDRAGEVSQKSQRRVPLDKRGEGKPSTGGSRSKEGDLRTGRQRRAILCGSLLEAKALSKKMAEGGTTKKCSGKVGEALRSLQEGKGKTYDEI